MIERRKFPSRGPVASSLTGMNDLRNVIFIQQPGHENLCCVGITVPLEENIEHEAVLVNSSPEPVAYAIDTRAHFIEVSPGTPPGSLVAQFFREEGSELYAPFAEGLVEEWRSHAIKRRHRRCFDQEGRPFTTMLT